MIKKYLEIINKAKNYSVSAFLAFIFCRNRKYYYVDCYGTLNPIALFIKNLVSPSRFYAKVRYGQVKCVPAFFLKSKPMGKTANQTTEFLEKVKAKTAEFKENGVVALEGHFSSVVEQLEKRYGINSSYFPGSNMSYVSRRFDIRNENLVAQVALDPTLLSIIGGYFGCQPFVRTNPHITASCPDVNFQEFLKNKVEMFSRDDKTGNMNWHYDTPNLVTMMVVLSEGTTESTHMLYAKKSHKKHYKELRSKFDYFYSEELVRDHFEVLSCVYPKGTAVIFDPNGLHRMNPIKNTFRSLLHVLYTPGNDRFWQMPATAPASQIQIQSLVDVDTLPELNLNELDDLQSKAIEGLFPKSETITNLQKVAVG